MQRLQRLQHPSQTIRRLLSAAICCLACSSVMGGPNLIRNGGFEEGPGQYSGVGKFWETGDGQQHPDVNALANDTRHSGGWSQWLKAHPTWDHGLVRQVSDYNSVIPGRTYDISVWIKTQGVGNPCGWYVFGIWWFNNDTQIGDVKMPANCDGCAQACASCQGNSYCLNYDWREISFSAVAPPGANRVAAVLTRHTDGHAWYDDVIISERTPGVPQISRSPASFTRRVIGAGSLSNDTFTIQNTGGGVLNYTLTDNVPWLSVTPAGGSSTGEIDSATIQYNLAGVTPGVHTATITITDANASNSPQTITVTLERYIPGDLDHDNDVDQADFGRFQACLSGPGITQSAPECAEARLDADADVDQEDFVRFLNCYSGPNQLGSLSCLP